MKIKKFAVLIMLAAILTSCSAETNTEAPVTTDADAHVTEAEETTAAAEPDSNRDMFDFVMDKWKSGKAEELYPYLSDEMKSLCDRSTLTSMFCGITDIFGNITEVGEPAVTDADGIDVYSAALKLENADVHVSLSLKDTRIYGFTRDIRFTNEFDITRDGICEHYFLLNGLNAVYTCAEGGKKSPAILLISGSGPSDYNETVGMLAPMEDIAHELAKNGISSLRFEKRALRFADIFKATDGLEEEYFADCRAALTYLRELEATEGIYLLGHSLGGQIAAELAKNDGNINGMILLMSSARHLADIMYDQFTAAEPAHTDEFDQYRNAAKAASSAAGKYYYFGASDAYWASYNGLDTADSIRKAAIPTVIINSTNDIQTFPEDISLWSEELSADDNVCITVYDGMSHYGYKIDTRDMSQLYKPAEMPEELIDGIMQVLSPEN